MFHRLGQFLVARARIVLALTVVLIAVSAVLGVGAFGRLLDEGFADPSAGSTQAKTLLGQEFGGETNIIFLVHAREGTVDQALVAADGLRLTQALENDRRLAAVNSYWVSHAPRCDPGTARTRSCWPASCMTTAWSTTTDTSTRPTPRC